LIGFGSILMQTYVTALRQAGEVNLHLRQRVELERRRLEHTWRLLGEAQSQCARLEQRDELLRALHDGVLHDGVGGQLAQALTLARQSHAPDEVTRAIESCVDDLQLVQDSSGPDGDTLPTALAAFRRRLIQRSRRQQIDVDWPWDARLTLPATRRVVTLQLLRILHELYGNTVRHARAQRIRIRIHIHAARDGARTRHWLQLRFEDDGIGLDAGTRLHGGGGLERMHRRARQIDARVRFESKGKGMAVVVLLRLPYRQEPAEPGHDDAMSFDNAAVQSPYAVDQPG
jgi:signal transduction histidine kinase